MRFNPKKHSVLTRLVPSAEVIMYKEYRLERLDVIHDVERRKIEEVESHDHFLETHESFGGHDGFDQHVREQKHPPSDEPHVGEQDQHVTKHHAIKLKSRRPIHTLTKRRIRGGRMNRQIRKISPQNN